MFSTTTAQSLLLRPTATDMEARHIFNPFRPNEHPGTLTAPPCLRCWGPTVPDIVEDGNPNGNAGRPYYTCADAGCRKFSCFRDMRGVHADNPACDCPERYPTRIQVAGRENTQVPRGAHFCCAVGRCGFLHWGLQSDGSYLSGARRGNSRGTETLTTERHSMRRLAIGTVRCL